MSRVTAIRCDWDGCNEVIAEPSAQAAGWLTIGGNRRGRYRMDICSMHARIAMREIEKRIKKATTRG